MEKSKLFNEVGLEKISGSFKKLYTLALLSIIGSIVISVMMYIRSESVVRDMAKSVIVIDGGEAKQGEVKEVNESELQKMMAENVVRVGVDYMYGFSATNYDSRIELASAYWGAAKNEILMSYKNQNVRDVVMSNNLTVDVAISKIDVQFSGGNSVGTVDFDQAFVNGSAVKKRRIVAEFVLKKVQPTNKNSMGLVIDSWIIKVQSDEQD